MQQASPSPRAILIQIAFPIFLSIVFASSVGVVDVAFVSRLGPEPLAAMAFAIPILGLLLGLANGFGTGVRICLAMATGAGDAARARTLATSALALGLLSATGVGLLGTAVATPSLKLLGAPEALLVGIHDYVDVLFPAYPITLVVFVSSCIFMGIGDTRTGARIGFLVAGCNLCLAPLLTLGLGPVPRLGIRGAALATVTSWTIGAIFGLHLLRSRGALAPLSAAMSGFREHCRALLAIGVPVILTNATQAAAFAVLTAFVAPLGIVTVSAWGAASRITEMVAMGPLAVCGGVNILVAMNVAADKRDVAEVVIKSGMRLAFFWGLGCWLVLALLSRPLAFALADDDTVAQAMVQILWLLPAGYGFRGIQMVAGAALNGAARARVVTALAAIQGFAIMLPLCFLGRMLGDFRGFLLGHVCAAVITAIGMTAALHAFRLLGSNRETAKVAVHPLT